MKKFTKGLLTGLGTGMVAGLGASIALLVMTERESVKIENDLTETMSDLVDYLKTEEGQKNKHLLTDIITELSELGEIRISKAFKNLAYAMELNKRSKQQLKGFLNDDIK